jgi:2-oxoglutarate ferredoxin oxidoreductase subunit alpha
VRGSGHNAAGGYTELPDEYQEVMDRLAQKHAAAATHVPEAVIERQPDARFGVVTLGSCDLAVREALETLGQRGITADYMRVRGFPFGSEVSAFLKSHDMHFVVEMNRDAQLRTLLVAETDVPKDRLRSVLHYGGFPVSAQDVLDGIAAHLGS